MPPPHPDALRELQAPPHRSAGPGGGAEAGQLCAADAAGRSVFVLRGTREDHIAGTLLCTPMGFAASRKLFLECGRRPRRCTESSGHPGPRAQGYLAAFM